MTATPKAQKRSYHRLVGRLRDAGFPKEFVERVFLPEWWEKECSKDPSLLPEIEFTVARFLRASIETVRDPLASLFVPDMPPARLRKSPGVNRRAVAAAMHFGCAVAEAVVRNLGEDVPDYQALPKDPDEWRSALLAAPGAEAVTLPRLVQDLWRRGIPVALVDPVPRPKFRGMAVCTANHRPVILLAWGGDDHPHFLIDLAHEAGHIASGHVDEGLITLDADAGDTTDLEDELVEDDAAIERDEQAATKYGHHVLTPNGDFGLGRFAEVTDPKSVDTFKLARLARTRGLQHGVDSGLLVHLWQIKTGEYSRGKGALTKLDKMGAKRILRTTAGRFINIQDASETDGQLLRCVVTSTNA